jgi:hypothetical protein
MDNMENKRQGMVTSTARDGLPPAPQYTQRQARGILGIQDQGMVEERRHSNHEAKEVLQMLGENYLRCTNRDSKVITEALTAPQHNVGKDRNKWERSFVTSVPCDGTLPHH